MQKLINIKEICFESKRLQYKTRSVQQNQSFYSLPSGYLSPRIKWKKKNQIYMGLEKLFKVGQV